MGAITKAWALAAQGHGLLWLYGLPSAGANTVAAIVMPTPTAFPALPAAAQAAALALFPLFTARWRPCLPQFPMASALVLLFG